MLARYVYVKFSTGTCTCDLRVGKYNVNGGEKKNVSEVGFEPTPSERTRILHCLLSGKA